MPQGAWKLGKGNYQLDSVRFTYDPIDIENDGVYFKPSEKDIKTLTANVTQVWTTVIADTIQRFKWKVMDAELHNALKALYDAKLATPAITYVFTIYDDRTDDISSTWTAIIKDFKSKKRQGFYRSVQIRLKLVEQLS